MAKYITNKELIKQTPFAKYLNMYLDYTSYTYDKYHVLSEQRLQAAKTYHELFIDDFL
jgi:hypothetical protein